MSAMASPFLPLAPEVGIEMGPNAVLVEDETGGRVYLGGMLAFAWDADDEATRALAAVLLVEGQAASQQDVAFAFGVSPVTVWRWGRDKTAGGVAALVPGKRGPRGPSKVTGEVAAQARARRASSPRPSYRAIGAALGLAASTVREICLTDPDTETVPAQSAETGPETTTSGQGGQGPTADALSEDDESVEGGVVAETAADDAAGEVLPVLALPVPRGGERARAGRDGPAGAVFTPCASAPLAGLFAALPGIGASGLLACARQVFPVVPDGFYSLETMLLEGVLRALAGQPRAEGATRLNPADLGRVLGMDRAPEVATIRRKLGQLAALGRGAELQGAIAHHHLSRIEEDALVVYVDGHVRAYQGTRSIAKTHVTRLRFPAPATVETWVSDSRGDPVMVVMAEPAASLAAELRALLPDLRTAVGAERRVLVGFDRGGWSPTLFRDMFAAGFDSLTWRKGPVADLPEDAFTTTTYTDEYGREHAWELADTTVDIPLTDGTTFAMRQVTRRQTRKRATRQVHILTTRRDLTAAEVVYRMGSRWRQENQFRYARIHLDLDSHDSYTTTPDDPTRKVPNPAKKTSRDQVQALYQRVEREKARTDAALLAATSGTTGEILLTNQAYNALTAPLHTAQDDLGAARDHHAAIPARVPLRDLAPDQQVLDTEVKLLHHAIRMSAHTTLTALARDIRTTTSYARAADEAHTLARMVLTHSGDIDPRTPGVLTITLDPMPTRRQTRAVAELCAHLTATATVFPGTDRVLRYTIKQH